MKKTILLVSYFLSFISFLPVFAQSGFIGKKNEFSINITGLTNGNYGGSYKFAYGKRGSLLVNYEFIHKTRDNLVSNRDLNYAVPNAEFNGGMFGIGVLWNAKSAGMNMPIGYYSGICLDVVKGNLQNRVRKGLLYETLNSPAPDPVYTNYYYNVREYPVTNKNVLDYNFKVTSYNFSFYFGKDIYVGKGFTLDLNIKFGFGVSQYKPSNFTPYPLSYTAINSYNQYEPKHVNDANQGGYTVYDKAEDVYYIKTGGFDLLPEYYSSFIYSATSTGYNGSTTSSLKYNYSNTLETAQTITKLKLILYPSIKIGYMF